MEREYKLTLSVKDTNETITLEGQFAPDDWGRLEEYIEYADSLLRTTFVQNGMQSSFEISWDRETGMTFNTQLPPWDDVIVFLHKYRPIGLLSESTYFYKICNILSAELEHPYFRTMIQQQRDIFSGKTLQTRYQIKINEFVLNSEKVLYDWLNAYEYHRNKEKQALIDSLNSILPSDTTKAIFLGVLAEKASAIHDITVFTRVLLGKEKGFEGTMRPPS